MTRLGVDRILPADTHALVREVAGWLVEEHELKSSYRATFILKW